MAYDPDNKYHREYLASKIRENLLGMGLSRIEGKSRNELVMGKEVVDGVFVYVYTSIVGDSVRSCGKDAIRVVAVDEKASRGLVKTSRIHRTGELAKIVERLTKRVDVVSETAIVRASWNSRKPQPKQKKMLTIQQRNLLASIVENGSLKPRAEIRDSLNELAKFGLVCKQDGMAIATERGKKSYEKAKKVFGS